MERNVLGPPSAAGRGSTMIRPRDENEEPKTQAAGEAKKPYVTPELVVHGSVEKITEEQKGDGQQDGGTIANPTQRSV